ncbi:hypothetical protein JCGZ_23829 [Jatropha curcas]|uniref:Pectinesterase n=2 Tax=Jatropha curcas TaxID=180498 RepID=A0A067L393_JATCU|nr:hypothetical protein JCGZ_23829 [Jatropha curcas]
MATFSHANPNNKRNSISLPIFFIINIFFLAPLAQAYSKNDAKPSQSHFSKFSASVNPDNNIDQPSISSTCKNIPHKAACKSLLMSLKTTTTLPKNPKELFDLSVQYSFKKVRSALELASTLGLSYQSKEQKTRLASDAMNDCIELLEDSLDQLSNINSNNNNDNNNPIKSHSDIQTWLSAALTNQETCIQSLQETNKKVETGIMVSTARNLSHYISNSLAIFVSNHNTEDFINGRKLLSEDEFPSWVSPSERKLLEASIGEIEAHAVVAKDGSGTHETLAEAIDGVARSLAGNGGGGRNVIYVKAGTYQENINIPTNQKNVMLVGDGKGKTVIVGSRNADNGWSTFQSATVAAMGDGFIAKDITFVNSAGPSKHQAVALRVGSDRSVIFRCSVEGYQDSLYTHSKRQFYRETDIYGTIDFIFGNSAVVFQNCNIFARKASSGSKNYVTAQGRTDPNQNTGISIHNCKIGSTSDASSSQVTYLGRPWQKFSRTVIMQSFLDNSINPSGWSPWSGNFALNTLFYAEYMNSGPGASTSGRVKWAGYRGILTAAAAQAFTVGGFIDGNMWLPSTGVSFDSGLIG